MYKLSEKNVVELFRNCCFSNDEAKDNVSFTIGYSLLLDESGKNDIYLLNPNNIRNNKYKIIDCFKQIYYNNKPVNMNNLKVLKDKTIWTNSDDVLNCLMMLGVMINAIKIGANYRVNDFLVQFDFDSVEDPVEQEYIVTMNKKAFDVLYDFCYKKTDEIDICNASKKPKDDKEYILASKYVDAFNILDTIQTQTELLEDSNIKLILR